MKEYCFVRYLGLSVFLFVFSAGCSQPLRTLIQLDKEKKSQERHISGARVKLNALLRDAKSGRLKAGVSSEEVIRIYGEPVLNYDGTFLYRDPVEFFDATKVYLIFDTDKKLLDINIEENDGR